MSWKPEVGELVWMNYPDSDEPEGRVVGFVAEGEVRAGQPIIERIVDEPPLTFQVASNKGDRVVIAPQFLLPFPFGSKEYQWRTIHDWPFHEEAKEVRHPGHVSRRAPVSEPDEASQ